jgi:hypothetical protein
MSWTKVLWNQRPLHHPAANRVCLHKEVYGTTWQLGLESCFNKDPTPSPNFVGTKRDALGWIWGFLFLMKLWATGKGGFWRVDGWRKWRIMGLPSVGRASGICGICPLRTLDKIAATCIVPPFLFYSSWRPPHYKGTLKPEASALSCCQ